MSQGWIRLITVEPKQIRDVMVPLYTRGLEAYVEKPFVYMRVHGPHCNSLSKRGLVSAGSTIRGLIKTYDAT